MKTNLKELKRLSDMNEQELDEYIKLKDRIFTAYLKLPKEVVVEKLESIGFYDFDADEDIEELVRHMSKIGFEEFDHDEIENIIEDDEGYQHLVELDTEMSEWMINDKFKSFTQNILEILNEAKTLPKEMRLLFDELFDVFYNGIFTCKSVISFDLESFELEIKSWDEFIKESWEITKEIQERIIGDKITEENVLAVSMFSSIAYEFYVEFLEYELPDEFIIAVDKTEDVDDIVISHDEVIMEHDLIGEFEFFNVYQIDNEGFKNKYMK